MSVTSDYELMQLAVKARLRAYAPYSKFQVGAALRCQSGAVFLGCNVENISYGLTLCAERVAASAAIAAGERNFAEMAIVADSRAPIVPCGACRQFLAEFNPDLRLLLGTVAGVIEVVGLRELLPHPRRGILGSDDV